MIAGGERSKMKGVQKLTVAALSAIGAVLNSDIESHECESKNKKLSHHINLRKNPPTSLPHSKIQSPESWEILKSKCAKVPCRSKNERVDSGDPSKMFAKDTKYNVISRNSSYNSATSFSTQPSFLTQIVTGSHKFSERNYTFNHTNPQGGEKCEAQQEINSYRKTSCCTNSKESQPLKLSGLVLKRQKIEHYENDIDVDIFTFFDDILKVLHPRMEDSLNAKLFNEDVIQRYIECRELYFELCAALIGKVYLIKNRNLLTSMKGRKELRLLFQRVSEAIEALAPCIASYCGTASAIDKEIRNEPVICLVEKCKHGKEHRASRPMKGGSTIFGLMGSLYPHHPVWDGSHESAVFRDISFEEFLATAIRSSQRRRFLKPAFLDSSKRFQLKFVTLAKSAFDFCLSCGVRCKCKVGQEARMNTKALDEPDQNCLGSPEIYRVVRIPLCPNCFC